MTVQLQSKFRLTQNGNPVALGKVFTYRSGTTTPLATYSDASRTIANANPVILDANGEADIYLAESAYTIVAKTSSDATVWTENNISGAFLTTSEMDARYVMTGQTSFVNATTRDVIANVRTYEVDISGISAYTAGQILSIIPDAWASNDTAYNINVNSLGDKAFVDGVGGEPAITAGSATTAVYDGTKFVQSLSAALLAKQSTIELVNDGGTEPTSLTASVSPSGTIEIEAFFSGGDPTLNIICDSIDLIASDDEDAKVNGKSIATREWCNDQNQWVEVWSGNAYAVAASALSCGDIGGMYLIELDNDDGSIAVPYETGSFTETAGGLIDGTAGVVHQRLAIVDDSSEFSVVLRSLTVATGATSDTAQAISVIYRLT